MMEKRIEELEKEIEKIKERNKKVEADKAWETSWARKIAIVGITYILIALVMGAFGVSNPLLNAIIPALGYLISTLSFDLIKKWWLAKQK